MIVRRFSIRPAKSHVSFRDIEERARAFEAKIDMLPTGAVVAVQIGNHEDWPSLFIACLRKQLVVLPLDQSISEQQRDAALEVCGCECCSLQLAPTELLRTSFGWKTAGVTADWGRKCAVAPKAYFRDNGGAALDSISQSSVAGRLQSDLRYDGHFRWRSQFWRDPHLALLWV